MQKIQESQKHHLIECEVAKEIFSHFGNLINTLKPITMTKHEMVFGMIGRETEIDVRNLITFSIRGKIRKNIWIQYATMEQATRAQHGLSPSGNLINMLYNTNCLTNCKMLHFFSLSFSEAAHAYSFHTTNFEILTKFSDSMAEKLSMFKILRPYSSIIPQWQKY